MIVLLTAYLLVTHWSLRFMYRSWFDLPASRICEGQQVTSTNAELLLSVILLIGLCFVLTGSFAAEGGGLFEEPPPVPESSSVDKKDG